FVDDEGSRDLFLGYAVAGVRLQHQLKVQGIKMDAAHPVVVYLPAGVGGSPSGVAFGLKMIMGANIYPVFCEPTHVPSVTLGMMTKLNEKIAVQDIGLDGLTAADGLAVSRPSRLAGKVMQTLLLGTATFEDDDLYRYLTKLVDTEDVMVEPSAAAGFTAIAPASVNGQRRQINLCQNCYQLLKNQEQQPNNGVGGADMAQDPFGFGGLDDIFRAMQGGVDPNNAYRQQQTPPTQPAGPNGGNRRGNNNGGGLLGQYGFNLTAQAKQGKIDPVIGRDTEINRVIEILNRRTKNNPVLIGEAGVG
ncbi:D-serine ammonia-lyase, partial [Klebsiella pneumoniae]|nr:D-serine ammonia-lyase [Klebsiella pneumoniae]